MTSKLFKRYYLEDIDRILPLEALVVSAYCIIVEGTGEQNNDISNGEQVICAMNQKAWIHFFNKQQNGVSDD